MLVIEEAKLPPPTPAMAATSTNVPSEVPGCITSAHSDVGTSRSSALATVQLRPPNRATASVYGTRSTAPTSVGVEVSRNLSPTDSPYFGPMNSTITDHRLHIEKPTCSVRMDRMRLRRAVARPGGAQNSGSSGSHCSIHRPPRRRVSATVTVMGLLLRRRRPFGVRCHADRRKGGLPGHSPYVTG